MKTSCIQNPPTESLIVIRQWQLEATGDPCSAAVLSFLTYWHDVKLLMRTRPGRIRKGAADSGVKDADLYQHHTSEQISAGLMDLYRRDSIRKALDKLVSLRFISVSKNPNPRFGFDRTKHFIVHPDAINRWIENYTTAKNRTWSAENSESSSEKRGTIPKTISGDFITENTLSKETPVASQHAESISFPAKWKPDSRTKEQKLASIPTPEHYPSEREFDSYLQCEDANGILEFKDTLYSDLCDNKWHHWNKKLAKWSPIRDWKKYVLGLDETITEARTARR